MHKTLNRPNNLCVHAETPYNDPNLSCNRRVVFTQHGWLCFNHAKEQSLSLPSRPRKPFFMPKREQTDDEIIRDIIQSDTAAITNGHIESVRFGSVDPIYLRYVS